MKMIPTIRNFGCCSLAAIAVSLGLMSCDVSELDGEENEPRAVIERADGPGGGELSPDTDLRYLDRDGSGVLEQDSAPDTTPPDRTRPLLPDEDGYTGHVPASSETVNPNAQNARIK